MIDAAKYICIAALALAACRSENIEGATLPSASASSGMKIIVSEALDAAPPDCSLHMASDAFTPPSTAKPAGSVKVEGDYSRILAKVSVTLADGSAGWSGTFNGPRDAFIDLLRRHVCAESHVYVLKAMANKDPTKGAVVLNAFEMMPDEKSDIDNFCRALTQTTTDAGDDLHDRAAMQWVEDVLTTTKWDRWRASFARERAALYAKGGDAKPLFHTRAGELSAAASALGLTCATAVEWKKR